MSKRISEVLEVIQLTIKQVPQPFSPRQLRDARRSATNSVAVRRRIERETVSDKYGRQLQPDIPGVDAFDEALSSWLRQGDATLRRILDKHSVDDDDKRAIRAVFIVQSEGHTH
jgi:hypothetical protein